MIHLQQRRLLQLTSVHLGFEARTNKLLYGILFFPWMRQLTEKLGQLNSFESYLFPERHRNETFQTESRMNELINEPFNNDERNEDIKRTTYKSSSGTISE